MKELVEFIVKELVEDKDNVEVEYIPSEDVDTVNVYVTKSDIGKVIGKQGKIAKAIRTIVRAGAGKQNRKCSVEIIERD